MDSGLQGLNQNNKIIWENQKKIANTQRNAGAETAVLLRLFIPRLNGEVEDKITPDVVDDVFTLWDQFSRVPDHMDYYQDWYMGRDVSEVLARMPEEEPEELKEEGPEDSHGSSEDYPEGAVIFGGDYASKDRDRVPTDSESIEEETPDEVPQLQAEDGEEDQPEDGTSV